MPTPRTKRIFVRVSAEEHQLLSVKANAAGITVSALVRDHIDQVRIYNHADKERWLRTISAMDNSVAALAKVAAALSPIDSVLALSYLGAIHRHLDRLARENTNYAAEIFSPRSCVS
jgi:hypothetical protein